MATREGAVAAPAPSREHQALLGQRDKLLQEIFQARVRKENAKAELARIDSQLVQSGARFVINVPMCW